MGNCKLKDKPPTDRPIELNNKLLQATVEENPVVKVEELAEKFGTTHSTVHHHLLLIGKVPKLGSGSLKS